MRQETSNFFDWRTIVAILLVGATFIGWQSYMQRKYPQAFKKQEIVEKDTGDAAKSAGALNQTPVKDEALATTVEAAAKAQQPEQLILFESETLSFQLSSRGMGLKDLHLRKYTDRKGEIVKLGVPGDGVLPLETRLMGQAQPLDFNMERINANMFVGRARIGALEVTKTLEFQPDLYSVRAKLSVSGRDQRFVGLSTALVDRVEGNGKGGFFSPSYEQQEFFVEEADAEDRVTLGQEEIRKSWSKVQLASLGSQYFTQAVVDHSPIMPEAKGVLNPKEKSAEILLQYPALNQSENFQLDFTAFLGPKSYYLLKQVNEELPKVVDFGFFNWIGRHILSMLQWFHSLVGNWGVAIILLTILVRFLVLPFNLYSYKSMRAMQMIQPQIQALRERHKDDQQKQQQEMLQLMRENRVNPVGGCLPVLLQFPIFIALYQVLGHSIELYQAPFMLWINDLSLKDPYYILPVLMGLTMFIQQKITPHTMDPAQAKVMLMMPLIFTFFMVSLPSGLTLYMLVGAIFSVLQQLYFMKDSKPTLAGAK